MGHVVKSFGHVVPKVLLDAREEAAALLARASAEADALQAAAAGAHQAARQEGFERGRADGVAEAAIMLAAARTEAAHLVEGAAATAIALATRMAEKIVGRTVALDPGAMAEIAAEALGACRPGPGTVRIRLHPEDLPAVEARRAALAMRAPIAPLELVADETVGRHGCVIETPQGRVDARLETQLAALERALGVGSRHG